MTNGERPTSIRYLVMAMLAMAMAGAYLTRNWAVVNTTLAAEFGYDDKEMGLILAGFAMGYMWFQVPGGWLGSRFGPRRVLAMMSVAWSLCMLWSSQATTGPSLYWSRLLMGLAQGGLVPCSALIIADWFPVQRRGVVSGIVASGMQVGALLSTGVTAALLRSFSWQSIFLAYSTVGVVWAWVFYHVFRDQPEEHPLVNAAELELIQGSPVDASPRVDGAETLTAWDRFRGPFLVMVGSVTMWAMCGQAFCRAFGYGFFSSWFPAYLEKARGLPRLESGLLNMSPILGFGLGGLMGGLVVDMVLVSTGSRWLSRSGTAMIALALCAGCTLCAVIVKDPNAAVLLISAGTFLAGLAGPPTWAAIMDISGKHTGIVTGIMNMSGNIGDAACAWGLGHLFNYIQDKHGNWDLVLYVFVLIYAIGAGCWLFLNPNRSVVTRSEA